MAERKHQLVFSSSAPIAPTIKRTEPFAWFGYSLFCGLVLAVFVLAASWAVNIDKPPGGILEHMDYWRMLLRHKIVHYKDYEHLDRIDFYLEKIGDPRVWNAMLARFLLSGLMVLVPFPLFWKSYMTPKDGLLHMRGAERLDGPEAIEQFQASVSPFLKKYPKDYKHLKLHPKIDYPPEGWNSTFILGAAGSGKTVVIGPIIKQALELDHRSLIYDVKGELTAIFFDEKNPAHVLIAPWDARGAAWDIAKDYRNPAEAAAFFEFIIPTDSNNPMFSNAAKIIGSAALIKCQSLRGLNWTWVDLADGVSRPVEDKLITRSGAAAGGFKLIGACQPFDPNRPLGAGRCVYEGEKLDKKGKGTGIIETVTKIYDKRHEESWKVVIDNEFKHVTRSGAGGYKLLELSPHNPSEPDGPGKIVFERTIKSKDGSISKKRVTSRYECREEERVEIWGLQSIVSRYQDYAALLAQGDENNVTFYGMVVNMLAFVKPIITLAEAWGDMEGMKKLSLREWTLTQGYEHRQIFLQGSEPLKPLSEALNKALLGYIGALVNSSLTPKIKGGKNPIRIFLDEFPQLGKIPNIGKTIEVGRSKGFWVLIAAQDKNQIKLVYSIEEMESWLAMCATKIYCRVSEGDTAKWVSEIIGKREVERLNVTHSAGAGSGKSTSSSYSQSEQVLYHPNELSTRLGPRTNGIVAAVSSFQGRLYEMLFPYPDLPERCPQGVEADWLLPTQEREDRLREKEERRREALNGVSGGGESEARGKEGSASAILEQGGAKLVVMNDWLADFDRELAACRFQGRSAPAVEPEGEEDADRAELQAGNGAAPIEVRGPKDYDPEPGFVGRAAKAAGAYEGAAHALEKPASAVAAAVGAPESAAAVAAKLSAEAAALVEMFQPHGKPPEQFVQQTQHRQGR